MCIVCTLYEQTKLTSREVIKAGLERIRTEDLSPDEKFHLFELIGKIKNKEDYENYKDFVKEFLFESE